jgi:hypothetical protein
MGTIASLKMTRRLPDLSDATKVKTMPDSIKPKKPRKGLPVFLHATGQYCWKFRNRFYYLGADPEAAIEEYLRTKDYIRAGKQPPPDGESGITLHDLCNAFHDSQGDHARRR